MNVVDTSGWLEYFFDGKNAAFFAQPILQVDQLIVPTLSLYEVFKRTHLQLDENAALRLTTTMQQARVVELDVSIALMAAKLSVEIKLPMADSIILATARRLGATLWTQDADFKSIVGVKYVEKSK